MRDFRAIYIVPNGQYSRPFVGIFKCGERPDFAVRPCLFCAEKTGRQYYDSILRPLKSLINCLDEIRADRHLIFVVPYTDAGPNHCIDEWAYEVIFVFRRVGHKEVTLFEFSIFPFHDCVVLRPYDNELSLEIPSNWVCDPTNHFQVAQLAFQNSAQWGKVAALAGAAIVLFMVPLFCCIKTASAPVADNRTNVPHETSRHVHPTIHR